MQLSSLHNARLTSNFLPVFDNNQGRDATNTEAAGKRGFCLRIEFSKAHFWLQRLPAFLCINLQPAIKGTTQPKPAVIDQCSHAFLTVQNAFNNMTRRIDYHG